MTRNPNLVPTVITDKRGVTRTVYKKPADGAQSGGAPLSLANAGPDRIFRTIGSMVEAIAINVERWIGDDWDCRSTVRGYPLFFIEEIYDLFSADDNDEIVTPVATMISLGEKHLFIKEVMHFHPKTGLSDMMETSAYVRALKEYVKFRYEHDLTRLSPEDQDRCIAIIKATKLMFTDSLAISKEPNHPIKYIDTGTAWDMPKIKNNALVQIIMDNPEQAERIGNIVASGITEPVSVQAVLDGIIPAVSDGAL